MEQTQPPPKEERTLDLTDESPQIELGNGITRIEAETFLRQKDIKESKEDKELKELKEDKLNELNEINAIKDIKDPKDIKERNKDQSNHSMNTIKNKPLILKAPSNKRIVDPEFKQAQSKIKKINNKKLLSFEQD